MDKKKLGVDKSGIQKVMRARDYFGDSLGQFALNLMSTLAGQLTYFYTDKVGMAVGAVATMFMICKIVDAFTVLIMGNIVDHTKPGKEKYRPWLIKAGIPSGIILVLMFTVPDTVPAGKMVYAVVTNILLTAVFFTAVSVPYGSLMVVRTDSQEERGIMGTCRAAAGYAAGTFIAIFTIPITNALGGTQSAWIKFSMVLGLIVILGFQVTYLTSRETEPECGNMKEPVGAVEEETPPFGETVKMLFKNKYWVIILLVNFMSCILYGTAASAGNYYCKWIFGNDNLVAVTGTIGMIPTILGFVLVGPMMKKLGIVKTLKVSFGMGIAANALLILLHDHFIAYCILGTVTTFATIPMMCLVGVMTAMAIDYNEYKYGVKMIAISNSASGFGGKVGSGIGASLIGWMLAAAHYDSTLAVAPQATKLAIYGFTFVVPLIMYIVMLLLVRGFDLEKKLPGMKEEIVARKNRRNG